MKGIYLKEPLNVLSCAVQGRPGRSAYESAVAGGYTGTPEAFNAVLAAMPGVVNNLNANYGRVNAILELLGNQICDLELVVEALTARVEALENQTRGTQS